MASLAGLKAGPKAGGFGLHVGLWLVLGRPRPGSRLATLRVKIPCRPWGRPPSRQGWLPCAGRKTLQTVTFPHPLKGVVSYLLKRTLENVFPLSLLHC